MRVGVIGCGLIARNHLAALRRIPGVHVVAVMDVDPTRARALAAAYGVPHAYGDLDDLLGSAWTR